jgi:hypothetical protein
MSFIRFIYNTFFKKFLEKSISLNEIFKIIEILNDIRSGSYIDKYERSELEGSQELAKHIDNGEELLPYIKDIINDKKRGAEIRQALLEHRVLVHSLFYNKQHVLDQLSSIFDELECQVRIEEERSNGKSMRVISPQAGMVRK